MDRKSGLMSQPGILLAQMTMVPDATEVTISSQVIARPVEKMMKNQHTLQFVGMTKP